MIAMQMWWVEHTWAGAGRAQGVWQLTGLGLKLPSNTTLRTDANLRDMVWQIMSGRNGWWLFDTHHGAVGRILQRSYFISDAEMALQYTHMYTPLLENVTCNEMYDTLEPFLMLLRTQR